MSYFGKVWIAATVAVVNGHADQGCGKLKSGLKTLTQCKSKVSSAASSGETPTYLRPLAALMRLDLGGERREAGESLRQVMYLDCWARG